MGKLIKFPTKADASIEEAIKLKIAIIELVETRKTLNVLKEQLRSMKVKSFQLIKDEDRENKSSFKRDN